MAIFKIYLFKKFIAYLKCISVFPLQTSFFLFLLYSSLIIGLSGEYFLSCDYHVICNLLFMYNTPSKASCQLSILLWHYHTHTNLFYLPNVSLKHLQHVFLVHGLQLVIVGIHRISLQQLESLSQEETTDIMSNYSHIRVCIHLLHILCMQSITRHVTIM